MCNPRFTIWPSRYMGQELYLQVWNAEHSLRTEYDIPENALRCGLAPPKQKNSEYRYMYFRYLSFYFLPGYNGVTVLDERIEIGGKIVTVIIHVLI